MTLATLRRDLGKLAAATEAQAARANEPRVALWREVARPDQLAPRGDWRTWLILAGRGWGKTRTGVGFVDERTRLNATARVAIVGATAGDVRDIMIEGESGLLAKAPPGHRPEWNPSRRRLTWPNGAIGIALSADEPDRARGLQWTDVWADELAAWRYPETWDQLMLGLRLGRDPRAVVTTTPRPTPIVRGLMAATTTVVTRGSTYDNRANLAGAFLEQIVKRYEGTRTGRQELLGEVLDDNPGALWARVSIEGARVAIAPQLTRIVVAVDPAVSTGEESDETGIVACGVDERGHAYVLDDLSGKYGPLEWARRAVAAWREHHADAVVVEVNQGGDMVKSTLRTVDGYVPIHEVRATRGKRVRAEPVASLYEQGKVHHVGVLATLEDQLCAWDPNGSGKSPDRMDAMVWAIADLMPMLYEYPSSAPVVEVADPARELMDQLMARRDKPKADPMDDFHTWYRE